MNISIPPIPPVESVEELRLSFEVALRRIVQQINNAKQDTSLDVNDNRIINVAWPVSNLDAVNVEYLKDQLGGKKKRIGQVGVGSTSNYWKGARAILPLVPSVDTDVMDNRYRVDIPTGKHVIITGVFATSKTDPSTGDFSADILRSDDAAATFTTIFSGVTRIKILNGEHRGEVAVADLAITELNLDDELRIDVLSNGAASGIEIVITGVLAPGVRP